jgi:hypothetical protein
MNIDLVYSFLINTTWFFSTSWVLLLVLACVVEFRHDLS